MRLSEYLRRLAERDFCRSPGDWDVVELTDELWRRAISVTIKGDISSLEAILHSGISVESVFSSQLLCAVEKDVAVHDLDPHGPDDPIFDELFTLLHVAAKYNRVAVIRLLLESGADVDLVSRPGDLPGGRGHTALFEAALSGHEEAVICLLDAGATPNVYGVAPENCILTILAACLRGYTEPNHKAPKDLEERVRIFRLLLQRGAEATFAEDEVDFNSMQAAVHFDRFDLVQELRLRGASCHYTLNHFICMSRSEELLDFLIENGASVGNLSGTLSISLDKYFSAWPCRDSATDEQLEAISLVLARFPGYIGSAAFYKWFCWSVRLSELRIVQFLARQGADVNHIDLNGRTPLAWATAYDRSDAISWLLENGAEINQTMKPCQPSDRGDGNVTALHFAVYPWSDSTVKHLLAAGADPNARTTSGYTPLLLLCKKGACRDFMELQTAFCAVDTLLQAGTNLNAACESGLTALHLLASIRYQEQSNVNLAKALMERGADPYAEDDQGRIPIQLVMPNNGRTVGQSMFGVLLAYTSDLLYVSRPFLGTDNEDMHQPIDGFNME